MAEEELFAAVESLMRDWRLEEATRLLERRVAGPDPPERIHHDLSVLYAQQGLFEPALEAIEAAMARDPANRAVWHHYLAIQKNNPVQPDDAAWKSMHLRFGDTLRERFDARHLSVARDRSPEARLRIGYLGPDTHNATERFVGPVLELFDRAGFEVLSYWNHDRSLSEAERFPDVTHRSIAGLATDAVVDMVLTDRIDILVDVAGHGAGNRLPALASRPAPIQMTWLDYLATTGLETVDYRITDGVADPPGAEARHVEALLRLAPPQWCYRPPREAPMEPPRAPRADAPIVFGAISVPLKLSAPLLAMWARLLASVPGSRLRFLGIPEGRARDRIESALERAGIGKDRLDIRGRLPLREFLSQLSAIDVALDTFPFNGATATLDALWQGTPVVSLAGRLSHSRSGASILGALGKPDWVAASEDEYIAIAARLAGERAALDRVRTRDDLARSTLCDGAAFVRALESGYREAWREWLRRTQSIASALPYANARADVLLSSDSADAARTELLLDTLPAHKVTGQMFWNAFRAAGSRLDGKRVALADIAGSWIAVTASKRDADAAVAASVPAEALEGCDALAAFGADDMPHGDPFAAGRGHVGGLLAEAQGDTVHARLWTPHHMKECVVLSGPLLLVRRALLQAHPFPEGPFARDLDFARAVSRYTFELHRRGVRLGIAAALALPSGETPGSAEQFRASEVLAEETGTAHVAQAAVSASALKAIVPAAAWPAFARRAEFFCDRHARI